MAAKGETIVTFKLRYFPGHGLDRRSQLTSLSLPLPYFSFPSLIPPHHHATGSVPMGRSKEASSSSSFLYAPHLAIRARGPWAQLRLALPWPLRNHPAGLSL